MKVNKWTAADVARYVVENKELFVLDVRNKDAYADWKIEGRNFEHLNIPYFDLLDGVEEILPQIPKDKDLLVVCAKEAGVVEKASGDTITIPSGIF